MSGREPVTVARFAAEHEARVAAEVLEAEGIQTFLTGTEFGAMYGSWVGTAAGGIELQVARDDLQRAREILAELSNADATDWQCSQCGTDVEGEFAVCWNCGAERELSADAADSSRDSESINRADQSEFSSYGITSVHRAESSHLSASDRNVDDEAGEFGSDNQFTANDELADKAFHAARLCILLHPLLIFALPQVIRLSLLELSPRGTRRFYFALLICVGVAAFWLTVYWVLLHGPSRS